MKTLWVSVGEVSGDMHASHVIRELLAKDPSLHIRGIGGTYLQDAGMECIFSTSLLSVMGIWDVIKRSFTIWKLIRAIKRDFQKTRPDALLVVDAPSFNFLLLRIAKKMNIPVYYYIIPKVWASRPHRVHFLSRYSHRLFCIFPFEIEWLKQYNINAYYVGNPLIGYLRATIDTQYPHNKNSIVFMPGSRKSEIERMFPIFIEVIRILQNTRPDIEFSYILAPSIEQKSIDTLIPEDISIQAILPEHRYTAISQASVAIVVSGTATLETTLLGIPTIATYKLGAFSAYIMKQFITIPFVSLPNIIMNKEIIPELLQENATPQKIAEATLTLLDNTEERRIMKKNLSDLYQTLDTQHNPPSFIAQKILDDITSTNH